MPYIAPPGRRLAYNRDGTEVWIWDYNDFVYNKAQLIQKELDIINNEDLDTHSFTTAINYHYYQCVGFLFPVPMDITHFFFSASWAGGAEAQYPTTLTAVQYSTDTTNGDDGTWYDVVGLEVSLPYTLPTHPMTLWRSGIHISGGIAATGIRFVVHNTTATVYYKAIHLYGMVHVDTTQRLAFCGVDGAAELTADKDFGNQQRDGTTGDEEKYNLSIKNMHETLTAKDVFLKVATKSCITCMGDLYNQLSDWRFITGGEKNFLRTSSEAASRYLYWGLTVAGDVRTVTVYRYPIFSNDYKLASGSRTGPGEIVLDQYLFSGLTGTVYISSVTPYADNTDTTANILYQMLDQEACNWFDLRLTSDPDEDASYDMRLDLGDIAPGGYVNVTVRECIKADALLGPHAVPLVIEKPSEWSA